MWMLPSNTQQRRRCKRLLTISRNPKITFEWAAIQSRRWGVCFACFCVQPEPLRDELGNIVKWYGSSTDIEDRKLAEVALRESEQRFRDYAETASDWLWETGPDHRVTRISEHINAIGGMPYSRIDMTRWDFAADTESEPEKWRLHRAMLDAYQPFRDFVYRIASGTGSPGYIRV